MLQGDVCKLVLSQERVRFWVQGQEAVLDEAAALALCVSPEGSLRIEAIGQEAANLPESDRPRLARGKDPELPRRFVQDPAWLRSTAPPGQTSAKEHANEWAIVWPLKHDPWGGELIGTLLRGLLFEHQKRNGRARWMRVTRLDLEVDTSRWSPAQHDALVRSLWSSVCKRGALFINGSPPILRGPRRQLRGYFEENRRRLLGHGLLMLSLVAFSVVSQEPPNPRLIGSALLLSATIAMTWVLGAREWLRS